ncbi:MAG TPA: glycosyltransferase [Cyanobacteria bacterium UBA11149]|nr:glycosyltransferase [Cyanobacteria bacterium UBA11367]HBE59540.1 glycosyltransferase [Cyanobacteria bacterium UBA11366]HBK63862.1 glycosyltransferase [Cyanobacteria bacterium UBA11166]HBR75579.1 glycosyltransferase [Cyanobacteria bacterium UBA11159]HBS68580.1 glycosyltransferase [Cyanobacteria bacterium UBA11153]HBW87414.1 glycosyltransferase [Cyanobacteria bacterium UBA11149]HCA93492.1 glycosyltransferase [Cyanobacteria bacterium UBA9226]
MKIAKISIIIPVLNEAISLSRVIQRLADVSHIETIVVDGGSQDETVNIAKSFGIDVICTTPGRASQMNAGAAIATGDILLFLHGDTILPANFDNLIRETLEDSQVIAGAFELRIDSQRRGLRLIEKMVNLRSHFFSLPYGDQGIFITRAVFQDMGGFPDLPIMEDFALIRSLRKRGKIAIIPASVITSGRRWEKLGVVKTTVINQMIVIGYFIGIPPHQLVGWYRKG